LDELKASYAMDEKELDIMKKDETTEHRKYESLKNSFEESLNDLENKKITLKQVQEAVPAIKKSIEEKQQEVQTLHQNEIQTANELTKIRMKIDENVQSMQANRTNNRVLNALMQQRQNGKIPGILGRLGDLGGIDSKYDVAISTCCGRLDNIVVNSVDTAQKCIEFLKNHNVGRATFIALEKVSHLMAQCKQRIQTPENVHRLFDLIRVEDERVLPAFYFALRDTLVADSLDQGTRIAYGRIRFRVVTLKGDVIEIAGTMSGGGKTMVRGKMGQQVTTKTANLNASITDKDLESLQIQAENMQCQVNDLQHQQGILESEIKILSKNLKIKEQEINKLAYEIKSLSEQLPRIEDSVKRQLKKAENTRSDPVKVKQLEDRVTISKAEFEKKQKEVTKIQKQVNELTDRIKEISDTKVKGVRVKIEKLSKQIDKLTTNISKLNVDIRTTERNMQKIEEKIRNSKTEIEEAETNIRKMDEERTQFDKDVEELESRVEEVTKEIESTTTDSSSIKKEVAAIHKQEADGKLARLEIEEKFKAADKKLQDETKKIPLWENKLKTLREIPFETTSLDPLKTYTDEELEARKLEDTQYEITSLEEKLKENKPNMDVIEEFSKKRRVYLERVAILETVTLKRNEIREGFDAVKKKRYVEFTEGFAIISRKLKEMYQMITLGGDAELELVDSMDPFSEGIVFSVRPPKKSWKMIINLSGGERTLSSLALVFALHYYKPSPLYFLDEIDAALDFKNVSIVSNYINVSIFCN
jgi:structural maintenance of chromosome 4